MACINTTFLTPKQPTIWSSWSRVVVNDMQGKQYNGDQKSGDRVTETV